MARTTTLGLATLLGAILLLLMGCDVAKGGSCDQIGSQHTNDDGTLYTCAKNLNTGKGYWYEGTP